MKKIILLITLLVAINYLFAQKSTLTIFAENGEKFWLVIDGQKINQDAQYRVENIELKTDYPRLKIIFQNSDINPLDKSIHTRDADGNYGSVTYNIKKNKKGKYVVRVSSFETTTQTTTVTQTTTQTQPQGNINNSGTTTVTQTATQTTTSNTEPEQATIRVNASEDGFSMSTNIVGNSDEENVSFNIAIQGTENSQVQGNSESSVTSSTTIVATTISSTSTTEVETVEYVPGYNGKTGCAIPIAESEFQSMKNSISSKSFEDSKLTTAKQIVGNNCVTAQQVKEIVSLFDYEDTRLVFAKFAYKYTYDISNYYKINDAFNFETTIDDLNDYINGNGSGW